MRAGRAAYFAPLLIATQLLGRSALADAAADEAMWRQADEAVKSGDYAQARRDLDTLAKHGMVKADCALGRLVMIGQGGGRDAKLGLEYCRAGADAGDPAAAVEVAKAYLDGKIVARSPSAAAGFLGRAADLRHGEGAYMLAELYRTGEGVQKDDEVAARWMRVAAEGGDKRAPFRLGEHFYLKGIKPEERKVIDESATQAAAWYMIAAELDPDPGQRSRAKDQLQLIYGVAPQLKRPAEQLSQDYRRRLPAS